MPAPATNRYITTCPKHSVSNKDMERVMPAQESLVDIHGRFIPRIVRMTKE